MELLNISFDQNIFQKEFSLNGIIPSSNPNELFLIGGQLEDRTLTNSFSIINLDDLTLSKHERKLKEKMSFLEPILIKQENNVWVSFTPEKFLLKIKV